MSTAMRETYQTTETSAGSLRKTQFHGDRTLTEKEKRMGEICDYYSDE